MIEGIIILSWNEKAVAQPRLGCSLCSLCSAADWWSSATTPHKTDSRLNKQNRSRPTYSTDF